MLTCDKKWPVCLFDFTYKNKVPEFFAFRVTPNSYSVRDDYFYPEMSYDSNVSSEYSCRPK